VTDVLSGPFAIAALALCVAGVAKLRSPVPAAQALRAAGLPSRRWLIRVFATAELALGAYAALSASTAAAVAVAAMYTGFAGLTLVLHRRHAACGCFGAGEAPASPAQSAISAALAATAAATVIWHAHGLRWIVSRPPGTAATLAVGICGAVFALVVAYSELPAAWSAWSAR
jgi:uncharacterized membrane protein YphA (DoxX/SURF4 family)